MVAAAFTKIEFEALAVALCLALDGAPAEYKPALQSAYKKVTSIMARETLAEHILAMEGDDYLDGHPEWETIVQQAKGIIPEV